MSRSFFTSLVAAGSLHAALLIALAMLPAPALEPAPPRAAQPDAESWLWVEAFAPSGTETSQPPAAAPAPEPGSMRSAAALARASRPSAAVARSVKVKAQEPAAEESALSSDAEPDTSESQTPEASAADSSEPAGLSLAELGVGAGNNPFLAPGALGTDPSASTANAKAKPLREALKQRLEQSLREGLALHDQKVGLGPEGPAISAVKALVLDSASMPNTSGLLSVRTDAEGKVTHVELLQAQNQSAAWQQIARDLLAALGHQKLRVPPGSAGVEMQIAVESRVALPSGADPGLAVELFGLELGDAAERATRIKILTPEIVVHEVEIPGTKGSKMKVVGFAPHLLTLLGDPVDIGAVARRVVQARLVALQTLPPEGAPASPPTPIP